MFLYIKSYKVGYEAWANYIGQEVLLLVSFGSLFVVSSNEQNKKLKRTRRRRNS